MKKLVISLFLCSPVLLAQPDQTPFERATQEAHQEGLRILERLHSMHSTCKTQDDPSCQLEYSEQFERYLTRNYVRLCSGQQSTKAFTYKTSEKEQCKDLAATLQSFEKRKNPQVNACVNECLGIYHRYLQNKWKQVPLSTRLYVAPWQTLRELPATLKTPKFSFKFSTTRSKGNKQEPSDK